LGQKSRYNSIKEEEEQLQRLIKSLYDYDVEHLNILVSNGNISDAKSLYSLIAIDKIVEDNPSSQEIFKTHNSITKKIQEAILDISNATRFNLSNDSRINYLGNMIQDKLLRIYEYSGQLLALSFPEILEQKDMELEQKRLLHLLSIELSTLKSNLVKNKILTKPNNYQALKEQATVVVDGLKRILDSVKSTDGNSKRDIERFSQKVERSIDSQDELYIVFIFTYKSTIDELKANTQDKLQRLIFGFFLIVLLSFYIFIGFYQSIIGNLRKLQRASEMIAKGKTDIYIDVQKKDEIGDAILAFNMMSDRLTENISFLD
jgi:HAMP domain-containing protein/CheY-specific phosphatase CheX